MNATFAFAFVSLSATLVSAAVPAAPPSPAGAAAVAPIAEWSQPVGVLDVLAAQPFVLTEPFESDWRQERPLVRSGWILVLEADAAVARVRQVASPILYVGVEVAERVNLGTAPGRESGPTVRLVVIVPAPLDEAGEVAKILDDAPIFFGTPAIAEQVDAAAALRERAAALASGLRPVGPETVARAVGRGGATLRTTDRASLLAAVAPFVRTWSPTEAEQADLLEGKPITRQATPGNP